MVAVVAVYVIPRGGNHGKRSMPGLSRIRECDRWLKANAVLGSILAIGMLAMAVAGLYSAGPNGATEISAVQRSSK